ncbi:hypothetical protein AB0L40_10940 [Patulibacter sp. NPDC049589]|uniref:hypothetical protein n=1 Tax=Patulibacter sp. NPDC049589 TaxID=3154731 RepID=UPI003426F2D3
MLTDTQVGPLAAAQEDAHELIGFDGGQVLSMGLIAVVVVATVVAISALLGRRRILLPTAWWCGLAVACFVLAAGATAL